MKKIKIKEKNKLHEILKVEWINDDGSKIMDVDKAVDPIIHALILQLEARIEALEKDAE